MHELSKEDKDFKTQVEAGDFPVPDFNHKAHIRLAYVYLVDNKTESAVKQMRNSLMILLKSAGVEPSEKYHETITEAWILAVHHFMNNTEKSSSANDFIEQNTKLLDTNIMLTHYSSEVLFSEKARKTFVEPNLDPIPRYQA